MSTQEETYVRDMVEYAPVGQGIADLNGVILNVNRAMCALLGRSRDVVVGRAFWEFIHPKDRSVNEDAIVRLLAGEADRQVIEFRLVQGDGSLVEVEATTALLLDAYGRPDRLIAAIFDISGRRGAEAALARQVAQQATVARLGLFALSVADSATLLTEACRRLRDDLAADTAGILRFEPQGGRLRLVAGVGYPVGTVGVYSAAADSFPAGLTLCSPGPVMVEDYGFETRFGPAAVLVGHGLRSGISVTVPGRAGRYGVLGVYAAAAGHFSEPDASFVQSVANVVASFLDRHGDEERARYALQHDQLTGAANRTSFLARAERALTTPVRPGSLTAVVFLDLDRFKMVNDCLGPEAGDELLVQIAARLRTVIRPGDTLGRLGGDEFAVLCPELASPGEALALAERFQAALVPAFDLGERSVFATASIGVAVSGAGTADAPGLLRQADAAMYRAKAAGRDQIEAFGPAMHQQAADMLQLSADLHSALDRRELRLVYQPLLRLRDGAVTGAEALLRWQHPTRGLLGPGEFIALAEDTGMIVPIGAWVLREACRAAARWPAGRGGEPLTVSVNVSARQLRDGSFVTTVAQALEASGLTPSALCLEITESLLMVDVEHSRVVLDALKDLGIRLSVDDFGTGYSSLSRLKWLPLDDLKIDGSFVDGLGESEDDGAIVASIVGLAHTLGMAVVAECVETAGQLEILRGLGCEGGQGWLWSEALPEAEFLAWLAHRRVTVDDDPARAELVIPPVSAPPVPRPGTLMSATPHRA